MKSYCCYPSSSRSAQLVKPAPQPLCPS